MGQCPRLDVPEESRYSIRRYYWSNYLQSDFDQVVINEDGSAEGANAIVESVVKGLNLNNVIYEDPRHAFYQHGQFSPTRDGRFLYSDQHHINDYSARIIIKNIWERHAGKLTKTK